MEPKLQVRLSRNHQAFLQLQILGYPPERIRRALHKLTGISQPDIARRLRISRVSVTRYMSGRRKDLNGMSKIASIFEIPVSVMFTDAIHDKDAA